MKKMIPLMIAFISAILAVLAAWSQYQTKEDERREKNVQKQKAEEFQKELLEKTGTLDSANIEIQKLQAQLLDKTGVLLKESKTVQKIQEESIKFMSGDGIPTLKFFTKANDIFCPIVFNETKYPIYDLRIKVDNFDEIVKCKSRIIGDVLVIDRDCIEKHSESGGPFFMAPGQSQGFNYDIKKSNDFRHYRIQIITRREIFKYLCIVLHKDEHLRYRIRTCTTAENGKLKVINETESGLKAFEESYWNKHLYLDKNIYTGPIEQDLKPE